MVRIAAGSFTMGSDRGGADEQPAHRVSLDAFYLDKYPVTQDSYVSLMGKNPSKNQQSGRNPVERVRWTDAVAYCNARSKRDGLEPCYREVKPGAWECDFQAGGYRLPTEAEWEYACRAGTDSDYCFGNDAQEMGKYAWYASNAGNKTHPVGQKQPNAWGLFDMHGNVWERCQDWYGEYPKGAVVDPQGPPAEGEEGGLVLRGGQFDLRGVGVRSATRWGECGYPIHVYAGFRPARTFP